MIPDFAGIQWVGAAARALWEPRIRAIGAAWAEAEIRFVEEGVRAAAIATTTDLAGLARRAAARGLFVLPLSEHDSAPAYRAGAAPPGRGEWRVAVGLAAAIGNWTHGDDGAGILLGYPPCCRRYFADTWGRGEADPTGRMAALDGPPDANPLLRWLGVRFAPHLPCSAACHGTISLAGAMRAVMGRATGAATAWAADLLAMPMTWSRRNGIGEVETPLFRFRFRSDGDPGGGIREGKSWPAGSARHLRFAAPDPAWGSNGFDSWGAMDEAHRRIEELKPRGPILDLGAGDGTLLRRLGGGLGIESDPVRARAGAGNGVIHGRIADAAAIGDRYGTALISVERLREGERPPAALAKEWVVYDYGTDPVWREKAESWEKIWGNC